MPAPAPIKSTGAERAHWPPAGEHVPGPSLLHVVLDLVDLGDGGHAELGRQVPGYYLRNSGRPYSVPPEQLVPGRPPDHATARPYAVAARSVAGQHPALLAIPHQQALNGGRCDAGWEPPLLRVDYPLVAAVEGPMPIRLMRLPLRGHPRTATLDRPSPRRGPALGRPPGQGAPPPPSQRWCRRRRNRLCCSCLTPSRSSHDTTPR